MAGPVRVTREVWNALAEEARQAGGLECCGLLAGRGGVITAVLAARNALGSGTAFEIAPEELFRLFRRMRALELEHLGIYHSHPATENAPSPSDIGQAYYPEAAYFIVSPAAEAAKPVRAFSVRDGRVEELEIRIEES
ncbi:MAG TPA: M67 family metallopeptidase [Candidatus Acidoferrales bacterium]|nr:M67 family metallopeptidase [Candidatus Acidoferrales bacterium]